MITEKRKKYYKKWAEENKESRKKYLKKYQNKRRWMLKKKAVDFLGGKCSICGYNKCIKALEFHHIDPTEKGTIGNKKDSTISYMIADLKSWKIIKEELKKCTLLCANCHREIHFYK